MDFTLRTILDKINYSSKTRVIVMLEGTPHVLELWSLKDFARFSLIKRDADKIFNAIRKEYDMIGLKHPHVMILDGDGGEHYL